MKNLLLIILTLLVFSGCAPDRPHIETEEVPFVVDKIERYNETHDIYTGNRKTTLNPIALKYPQIVAQRGYAIGDTIKIKLPEE